MTLPKDYLEYPNRHYGMDHDRYGWSILPRRAGIVWPNGAKLALMVTPSLEFFPLDQTGKPFKLPGGMVTPYPDLRHFTLREYGNRVGIFRLFQAFERHGIAPTIALNARLADRNPILLAAVLKRGYEIIGHGWDMDTPLHGGMAMDDERALIQRCLSTLRTLTGQPVAGWLSPGKSQSLNTPDLLAEAGIRYACDWINDDLPYAMKTGGGPLIALPHAHDISDRTLIFDMHHSADEFAEQVIDQFDTLYAEATPQAGRMLSLSLHPWITGQPHRIKALEGALAHIMARPGVWSAAGSAIVDAVAGQIDAV